MTPAVDQVANLCRALEYYGASDVEDDMRFVRSAVNLPVFNMAVLLRPLEGQQAFGERIRSAQRFFRSRNTGWSFWLCEALLDRATARRLPDLFEGQGMSCVADTPGMEIEGIPACSRALPELDCRPATRPAILRDFCAIVAESFNVPIDTAARLYTDPGAWSETLRGWVGYERQMPVATAVTAAYAGVVGIYSVATHPARRRRGYAETVMRHAMADAQRRSGLTRFVLQSSPAGRSLYRKMGFRKISRFLVFSTAG